MQKISQIKFFALYAIICLIWGSTWLVIHLGNAAALPPFSAASLRFVIAAFLLWIYIFWKKIALPATDSKWTSAIIVGLLSNGLSFGIVYFTSGYVPSGLASVVFGTMPLWTAVFAHYGLPTERLSRTKIYGIGIGILGIVIIFLPQFALIKSETAWALPVLLFAPIVSGMSAVITKKSTQEIPAITLNAITTSVGAITLGLMALLTEKVFGIELSFGQLAPTLYLAIFGTIITFGIYFKLMKTTSAVTMSYVAIITPAIAVLLGWMILGEKLDGYEVVGTLFVLCGVAISLRM